MNLRESLLINVGLLNKGPHIFLYPLFVLGLFLVSDREERRVRGRCPLWRLYCAIL